MTNDDAKEAERLTILLRAAAQAEQAGVCWEDAVHALYPDVYEPEHPHNPETCRDPACDCMPF